MTEYDSVYDALLFYGCFAANFPACDAIYAVLLGRICSDEFENAG